MSFLFAFFYALTNLTGVVTFARESDDYFFILDSANSPWRVARLKGYAVTVGEQLAVKGTREPTSKHRLDTVSIKRSQGRKLSLPEMESFSPEGLYSKLLPYGNPALYGRVIKTEGIIIDINRRQMTTQLLIGQNNCNFQCELPISLEKPLPKDMMLGAWAEVTGVLVYTSIEDVENNIAHRIENIEIMPQSANSVRIIKKAPFWTVARISWAFGTVLSITGVLLLFLFTRRRFDKMIADAERRERLRIAADLHDGFQQYLAGSMFRLQAALNLLPAEAEASRLQLEGVKDALQHTQNGLRSTLWAMTEESQGPESLMELIRYASSRMAHWQGKVTISYRGRERAVARNLATRLLLIIQEAVGNALKHGGAGNVEVCVNFGDVSSSTMCLEVIDDGCGFDASQAHRAGHYGLRSMEKRCRELGGEMNVQSSSSGTKLSFTLNLNA